MSSFRLILLALAIAGISMPAAATSAVTIEAFGEFCLERAILGKPVAPAAEEWGMEITSRISESYAPDENVIKVEGIPLVGVTGTVFGAQRIQAPMPEGIVVLQLGMSNVKALDPAGRNVELVNCIVVSAEKPAAARALIEVQRDLSDRLPPEAVASVPYSSVQDRITSDHIYWTWGDIDSDTGRFRVGYNGNAGPGFMGGGIISVLRIVRAPE